MTLGVVLPEEPLSALDEGGEDEEDEAEDEAVVWDA